MLLPEKAMSPPVGAIAPVSRLRLWPDERVVVRLRSAKARGASENRSTDTRFRERIILREFEGNVSGVKQSSFSVVMMAKRKGRCNHYFFIANDPSVSPAPSPGHLPL